MRTWLGLIVACVAVTDLGWTAPPVTAGLVLHLETDAGLVATGSTLNFWDDQSPAGNHLVAAGGPTVLPGALNGHPVVRFDGVDDKCERTTTLGIVGPPTGNGDRTVFLLARYLGTGPGGFSYGRILCNQAFGLIVLPDGTLMVSGLCSPNDFGSLAVATGGPWLVQSAVLESGTLRHYRNLELLGQVTHAFNTTQHRIVLGAEIDSSPLVEMDVAAALIYDRALTPTEHQAVLDYLNAKYLAEQPPGAVDDLARCLRGGAVMIDVLANDSPAALLDPSTVSIVSPPTHGSVSVDPFTGALTYTHEALDQVSDELSYTVQLTGNGMVSAPARVRLSFDDPGCALVTTGLVLHLDAATGLIEDDLGAILGWLDHSGARNDLFASGAPTQDGGNIGGHTVVVLDGVDDHFERPYGLNGLPLGGLDRSFFVVVEYQGVGPAGVIYGKPACNQAFGLLVDSLGVLMLAGWCTANDFTSTEPGTGVGWLVQSARLAGGTVTHAVDGMLLTTASHAFNTQPGSLAIGTLLNGTTHIAQSVAEILLYDRALSPAESTQVLAYLRGKYFAEFCTPPCLPPQIAADPLGQVVCEGEDVLLEVAATGTNLSYQWRVDGLDVAGAQQSTLLLSDSTALDAGSYDVRVTNACGSVLSAEALLVVQPPASIVSHPAGSDPCEGQPLVLGVVATGTQPLTYAWFLDGMPLTGADEAQLQVAAVSAAEAGTYTVVVSSPCGNAISDPAVVLVRVAPTVQLSPIDQIGCLGGTATFSVVADGAPPLAYQWRRNGVDLPGAESPALVLSSLTAGDSGAYDVHITNACGMTTSALAQLAVDSTPQVFDAPAARAVCEGFPLILTVSAGSAVPGTLVYQWRKDGIGLPGTNTSALEFPAITPADAGDYDVVVTNGCSFVTTSPATVQVLAQAQCDCNTNGVLDADEIATGQALDCNLNNVLDACDLASGTSQDTNLDGIPDECARFRRGNCNGDTGFNIADPITLLNFLFPTATSPVLPCAGACDCNDDGGLNIADAVCMLTGLFGDSPVPPPPPYPGCGSDPTPDALSCDVPCL